MQDKRFEYSLDKRGFLFRISLTMTSLDVTIRKCREKGMRITPQRIMILRQLLGNRNHPTAEDIYRSVCRLYPNVSLATIYNTLNMLIELGEIKELNSCNGNRRFDPNLHPHDHAVCTTCDRVFDVARSHSNGSDILAMGKKFNTESQEVLYRGKCWICSTMSKSDRSESSTGKKVAKV